MTLVRSAVCCGLIIIVNNAYLISCRIACGLLLGNSDSFGFMCFFTLDDILDVRCPVPFGHLDRIGSVPGNDTLQLTVLLQRARLKDQHERRGVNYRYAKYYITFRRF